MNANVRISIKISLKYIRKRLQWNLNRNSYIFIHENAFKTSSAKWVKHLLLSDNALHFLAVNVESVSILMCTKPLHNPIKFKIEWQESKVSNEYHARWSDVMKRHQNTASLTPVRTEVPCHGSINLWWRHQMETFSAWLAICAGNSPHSGSVTRKKFPFDDVIIPFSCWVLVFELPVITYYCVASYIYRIYG